MSLDLLSTLLRCWHFVNGNTADGISSLACLATPPLPLYAHIFLGARRRKLFFLPRYLNINAQNLVDAPVSSISSTSRSGWLAVELSTSWPRGSSKTSRA